MSQSPDVTQVSTSEIAAAAAIAGGQGLPGAPAQATPAGAPTPGPMPNSAQPSQDPGADSAQATAVANVEEPVVWAGRYCRKNFAGRITLGALLTAGWAAAAFYYWGGPYYGLNLISAGLGVVVVVYWLVLLVRFVRARYGHRYELTTRRLFISTGVGSRRRDQLELLRVKDVFVRQTWMERMLSVGSVVIVTSEESLPTAYLTGVNEPKAVMDLVWRYARAEQDRRSVRVDSV